MRAGDVIVRVNAVPVLGLSYERVCEMIEEAARVLTVESSVAGGGGASGGGATSAGGAGANSSASAFASASAVSSANASASGGDATTHWTLDVRRAVDVYARARKISIETDAVRRQRMRMSVMGGCGGGGSVGGSLMGADFGSIGSSGGGSSSGGGMGQVDSQMGNIMSNVVGVDSVVVAAVVKGAESIMRSMQEGAESICMYGTDVGGKRAQQLDTLVKVMMAGIVTRLQVAVCPPPRPPPRTDRMRTLPGRTRSRSPLPPARAMPLGPCTPAGWLARLLLVRRKRD